jgi:multidrug efflux pump subunit AcrB
VRVNLVHKKGRQQQSHELILRLRNDLARIAQEWNANIKLVELPAGPPVVATVVAEIYGRPDQSYIELREAAEIVRRRLQLEAGVVDVDTSIEADQIRYLYRIDKEKAALNGVSTDQAARTLELALTGRDAGILRVPEEVNPLMIELRLPRPERSSLEALRRIYVRGDTDHLVTLGEIGAFETLAAEKSIYHKNLERVAYVFAETAGRAPAEAILDIIADRATGNGDVDESASPRPPADRSFLRSGAGIPWSVPDGIRVVWSGEGEWDITLRVFRDLGLAFAAACLGIYVLLVYQTGSYFMPLILMISIPLTIIGIMPGFWLLNLMTGGEVGGFPNPIFFTATAMIGMIALSGIVVRNAILLIEFVHQALARGLDLQAALIQSGAVRTRPILLTAGSALLAAWPITLDPIFSGLAWALIFGLLVSTPFTLLLVPVVYSMVYANRPGHGLPSVTTDGHDASTG